VTSEVLDQTLTDTGGLRYFLCSVNKILIWLQVLEKNRPSYLVPWIARKRLTVEFPRASGPFNFRILLLQFSLGGRFSIVNSLKYANLFHYDR
jgi:hypothetical protein